MQKLRSCLLLAALALVVGYALSCDGADQEAADSALDIGANRRITGIDFESTGERTKIIVSWQYQTFLRGFPEPEIDLSFAIDVQVNGERLETLVVDVDPIASDIYCTLIGSGFCDENPQAPCSWTCEYFHGFGNPTCGCGSCSSDPGGGPGDETSGTGGTELEPGDVVRVSIIAAPGSYPEEHTDDDEMQVMFPGREFVITLDGVGTDASGTAVIANNPRGPDRMTLRMQSLPPEQRIAVFLTKFPVPGTLPAQFIGEFTTDGEGRGELFLEAEIGDAYATANQSLENAVGWASDPTAGRFGGGANPIYLNWIQGYFVDMSPNTTVYGPNDESGGGAVAFVGEPALPSPAKQPSVPFGPAEH